MQNPDFLGFQIETLGQQLAQLSPRATTAFERLGQFNDSAPLTCMRDALGVGDKVREVLGRHAAKTRRGARRRLCAPPQIRRSHTPSRLWHNAAVDTRLD